MRVNSGSNDFVECKGAQKEHRELFSYSAVSLSILGSFGSLFWFNYLQFLSSFFLTALIGVVSSHSRQLFSVFFSKNPLYASGTAPNCMQTRLAISWRTQRSIWQLKKQMFTSGVREQTTAPSIF